MLNNYLSSARHYLFAPLLLLLLLISNNASASLIEYQVDLFGPGFKAKHPVYANLESQGTIIGKFNNGVLTDITGETSLITITDGYIASGYYEFDNFIFGTFKDTEDVPEFFRNKDIFLDLSRGAEYEETIVTESIIREWAWALFVFDDNIEFESEEARKDRNHPAYRTIRKQKKTFQELCSYYYGNCSKAGGEFFGDYGKRIPDTPIPLPAAFYLFAAGLVGLIRFTRRKKEALVTVS